MLGNSINPPEKKKEKPSLSTFATPIESVTPMATGGIVTAPTRALVGEAGSEAVLPLDPFTSKLDELITETRNIANMRVQLETGVITGHMTNGGTKTGG